jgi:HNH endonuclease
VPENSDSRRREWFELGVDAFTRSRPGAPRLYCCPLCVRGFDAPSAEALSFEHVPPKSVGGKPLVLTCRKCNSTHGSDLDAHIKTGRDLGEILEGKRPTWARLRRGDSAMAVKATLGADAISLVEVAGKSNPTARDALASHLEGLVGTNATGSEFNLEFSIRHDEWRERIGWLRVAYLYLFALLGYSFILRPELNPIREQFRNPAERIVPQIIKHMTESAEENHIVSIFSPRNLRGIGVQLGKWMLFFPGFLETDSFYDRLAELPEGGHLSLSGKALPFPEGPVFLCDFHPEAIRYLVPPESLDGGDETHDD